MKGYDKERYQSHQDSIGWKQKDGKMAGRWIGQGPGYCEQVVYQQFATKPRDPFSSGRGTWCGCPLSHCADEEKPDWDRIRETS